MVETTAVVGLRVSEAVVEAMSTGVVATSTDVLGVVVTGAVPLGCKTVETEETMLLINVPMPSNTGSSVELELVGVTTPVGAMRIPDELAEEVMLGVTADSAVLRLAVVGRMVVSGIKPVFEVAVVGRMVVSGINPVFEVTVEARDVATALVKSDAEEDSGVPAGPEVEPGDVTDSEVAAEVEFWEVVRADTEPGLTAVEGGEAELGTMIGVTSPVAELLPAPEVAGLWLKGVESVVNASLRVLKNSSMLVGCLEAVNSWAEDDEAEDENDEVSGTGIGGGLEVEDEASLAGVVVLANCLLICLGKYMMGLSTLALVSGSALAKDAAATNATANFVKLCMLFSVVLMTNSLK